MNKKPASAGFLLFTAAEVSRLLRLHNPLSLAITVPDDHNL